MKDRLKTHYKTPPTRQAASTVGAVGEKVRRTNEFCASCPSCIPNPQGLPGCGEGVPTGCLVQAGDITNEHILSHAPLKCLKRQQN